MTHQERRPVAAVEVDDDDPVAACVEELGDALGAAAGTPARPS